QAGVRGGIRADAEGVFLGDGVADTAQRHAGVQIPQRGLETFDVLAGRGFQQVEGDALRAFRPDAREARGLVDDVLKRTFKQSERSPFLQWRLAVMRAPRAPAPKGRAGSEC